MQKRGIITSRSRFWTHFVKKTLFSKMPPEASCANVLLNCVRHQYDNLINTRFVLSEMRGWGGKPGQPNVDKEIGPSQNLARVRPMGQICRARARPRDTNLAPGRGPAQFWAWANFLVHIWLSRFTPPPPHRRKHKNCVTERVFRLCVESQFP